MGEKERRIIYQNTKHVFEEKKNSKLNESESQYIKIRQKPSKSKKKKNPISL